MIDYWRQLGVLTPREMSGLKVSVIGAGGIGSPTILAISKMGLPQLTVYDDDVVGPHNIPNQFYRLKDIGRKKVEALKEIVADFSQTSLVPVCQKFTSQTAANGIIISAVDKMSERQEIWKSVRYNINVPFYIEARMGIEVLRMYTIRPTDPGSVKWYEKKLYDDDHALAAPCTERAIAYTVFMAAALISNQFKKVVKQEAVKKEVIIDMKNLILMLQ